MIRLVLADDHTVTREGTRRLLEGEGDLEIIGEAADGDEAVRLVRQLRPDLLVLDVSMPGRDGLDVARELRAAFPETKILILTGYGDNGQYARALLRLGVHGYLSKTVRARELIGAIQTIAAGGRCFQAPIAGVAGAPTEANAADEPTAREEEILRLVAAGLRNRDIAHRLGTSERTVEFHLTNLFAKFGVASRTELLLHARQQGWLV
ncbi:MAG: response regulator transcription factor [Chloroflexota bacterium]